MTAQEHAIAYYSRAEDVFFRSLSEQQWAMLDDWSRDRTTMDQLAASLSPEQEPLMQAWATRLVALIEATVHEKVRRKAS